MANFEETFGNCSEVEKTELVWHLASLRFRRTIEAFLPAGAPNPLALPVEGWKPAARTPETKGEGR